MNETNINQGSEPETPPPMPNPLEPPEPATDPIPQDPGVPEHPIQPTDPAEPTHPVARGAASTGGDIANCSNQLAIATVLSGLTLAH